MIVFENWNSKSNNHPNASPFFSIGATSNYTLWKNVTLNATTQRVSNYFPQYLPIYKNDQFPDQRIQYYFTPNKVSIGMKRNIMARLAKGKYILHMDDDDFYTEKFCAESIALFNDLQKKSKTNITIIKRLTYLEFDITLKPKAKHCIDDRAYFFVNTRPRSSGWAFVE